MASVSFDINTGIVVSALRNLGALSTIKRIAREVSETYNFEITPDLKQVIKYLLHEGTKLGFFSKQGNKYELAYPKDDELENTDNMDAMGRRRRKRRTMSPKRGKSRSRSRSPTRRTKK